MRHSCAPFTPQHRVCPRFWSASPDPYRVSQFHPDVSQEEQAEARFVAITEAYECLVNVLSGRGLSGAHQNTKGNSQAFHDWWGVCQHVATQHGPSAVMHAVLHCSGQLGSPQHFGGTHTVTAIAQAPISNEPSLSHSSLHLHTPLLGGFTHHAHLPVFASSQLLHNSTFSSTSLNSHTSPFPAFLHPT